MLRLRDCAVLQECIKQFFLLKKELMVFLFIGE